MLYVGKYSSTGTAGLRFAFHIGVVATRNLILTWCVTLLSIEHINPKPAVVTEAN